MSHRKVQRYHDVILATFAYVNNTIQYNKRNYMCPLPFIETYHKDADESSPPHMLCQIVWLEVDHKTSQKSVTGHVQSVK